MAKLEIYGFPSPNLGLSLKCRVRRYEWLRRKESFRPLIWGYLWNIFWQDFPLEWFLVSVPLFGVISEISWNDLTISILVWFPSPNLGLSLKSQDLQPLQIPGNLFSVPLFGAISENKEQDECIRKDASFRPLIWGYLWNHQQKQWQCCCM